MASYLEQKDDLHAGRKPREQLRPLTVKDLVNHFLNAKRSLVDSGELSPWTWEGNKKACDAVVAALGKSPAGVGRGPGRLRSPARPPAKRYGRHRLGTSIQCVRCAFKHGFDAGLYDRPMRYGPSFRRPSRKSMRIDRAQRGAQAVHAGGGSPADGGRRSLTWGYAAGHQL